MISYLKRIAQVFAREAADNLQQYTFVFPNHRAGLFFRKYLAQSLDKPIFSPNIITINECFASLSHLRLIDPLHLLLRLYHKYRTLRTDAEPLEEFLFWGKMMLSDFSEVDNHLVEHVEQLFTTVRDLKVIDTRFDVLSDTQKEALRHFWGEYIDSLNHHKETSLHTKFAGTWDLLWPLYSALREELLQEGLAWDGMLHREVIEHFDSIPEQRFAPHYVFIGFNALTRSEEQLMRLLQSTHRADFYFDYESRFLKDDNNRASLFRDSNLKLFHSTYSIPESEDGDDTMAEMHLVSVSGTVEEASQVHRILSQLYTSTTDQTDFTRTAVVLPDEQLLLAMMHTIPPQVKKVNVTMGYPLTALPIYMPIAYPENYFDMPETANEYLRLLRNWMSEHITEENSEGIYQIQTILDCIEGALDRYIKEPISVKALQEIIRMQTLQSAIPYAGEPLDGLQIMGVLETRALDFDNLIITGFNDDLYPGRTKQNSFIPYILRRGFNLPTPERQDAIFAYNFYRMLSYAKQVWFITNAAADDRNSGEVSRYFYQLSMQYNLPIQKEVVSHNTSVSTQASQSITKTPELLDEMRKIEYAPTILSKYLRCQKQFYFRYLLHIPEPNPNEETSISELTIGKVFHNVMDSIYRPYVNKSVTEEMIQDIMQKYEQNWNTYPAMQSLDNDPLASFVVKKFVNDVLVYDMQNAPFVVKSMEQRYAQKLAVDNVGQLRIQGVIDRLDIKEGIIRVVDYKTGKANTTCGAVAELFDSKKPNTAAIQTLFYCLLYRLSNPNETLPIAPHIYSVSQIAMEQDYVSQLECDKQQCVFADVQEPYTKALNKFFAKMFDISNPFMPADDTEICKGCAFASICR